MARLSFSSTKIIVWQICRRESTVIVVLQSRCKHPKSLINSWYLLRVNKCLPFWSSRSSSCFIIFSFCTRIVQVRVKCTLLWQQNRFDYKTLNIWLCDDWLVLQVCCFATRFLWRTLFEIVFPRYIYMNERCSCFLRNYITGFCQLRLPRVTRLVWSKQKPVAAS